MRRLARDLESYPERLMKSLVLIAACSAALFVAPALAQEDLAKSAGCLNCHAIDTKKAGPAFKEIAAKFKGKADAEATLVAKLKDGKGHPAVEGQRGRPQGYRQVGAGDVSTRDGA
jgi:cytochrome c